VGANQKKQKSSAQGCLGVVLMAVIIIVVIAAASSGSSKTPKQQAEGYIKSMNNDMNRVQASVLDTEVAVGLAAKSPTTSNVNQLAQVAQQAHDSINNIRDDFATSATSGRLGNAEVELFTAANDLKNSMGAVVAYTGNPNPATLAHFTSQFQNAKSEWNDVVRTVWRVAGESTPPTV
jgi:hypothetical protein